VLKANNLPPSCAVVKKSGSLNFLESSGPVQACNGIALLRKNRQIVKRPSGWICLPILNQHTSFFFSLVWFSQVSFHESLGTSC